MSGWGVMQKPNDTTNYGFMEELLVKAETRQDPLDLVSSNMQVMGRNTLIEQLPHNPDGMGISSFKTEKSLK